MDEPSKNHKATITFAAILLIAVIITAAVAASPKKQSSNTVATNTNSSQTTGSSTSSQGSSSTSSSSSSRSFKDGTYVATGSYDSPGGTEQITVHITLQGGTITATSADSGAQDPEAEEYQQMFIDGYKSQVIGKNITDVQLSRVSGSSLTSQGFNDAIGQIEQQAKA